MSTPSPGRPRSFATERALEVAVRAFWKHGYRGTTTRVLESELDLRASSIYNAFGSKQALLLAAIDRYEARITNRLVEPLETSEDGLGAVETFVAALGDWIRGEGRRGCMLVNLLAEEGLPAPVARRVHTYRTRLRSAVAAALDRAASLGEIPAAEAGVRADLLLCQIVGVNVAARGGASPKELSKLVYAVQRQLAEWRRKGGTNGHSNQTPEAG